MNRKILAILLVICVITGFFVPVNASDTAVSLYLLSGRMQSHTSGGGTTDTYANNIGETVTVVETGATVELKDDAATYQQAIDRLSNINNGLNATDRNLNDQVWLIDAAATELFQQPAEAQVLRAL